MENGGTIPLCGLWKNTSKQGEQYLSGRLGNAKIMVFKNRFKTEENHPDFRVVIVASEPKQRPANGETGADDGWGDEPADPFAKE